MLEQFAAFRASATLDRRQLQDAVDSLQATVGQVRALHKSVRNIADSVVPSMRSSATAALAELQQQYTAVVTSLQVNVAVSQCCSVAVRVAMRMPRFPIAWLLLLV